MENVPVFHGRINAGSGVSLKSLPEKRIMDGTLSQFFLTSIRKALPP
jgi:hypothetical protein